MILDYLRKSTNGEIIIPNFHTGHLGFVPGTEVSVSLHELFISKNRRQCELLVTPFDPNFSSLCYLTCTMKDQPGVVNKLIEAISSLSINIVKQESSSINSLNHHVIELVLDWKTSQYKTNDESTPLEIVQKFNSISHLLPLKLYKYFILYKAIMSRCGDVINFNNVYGENLPSLKIIPFTENMDAYEVRRVTIKRKDESKIKNAYIELDSKHLSRIRNMCDSRNGEPLTYIISSEANTRSLRIFFLNSASVSKIFHISFAHNDEPGALSAITSAIAEANFNILTGLLRKKDTSQSRYETLLEYQGNDTLLPNLDCSREERVDWVFNKICSLKEETLIKLLYYSVEVSQPLYPNRNGENFELKKVIYPNLDNKNLRNINSTLDEIQYEEYLLENTLNVVKSSTYSNSFYKKERIEMLEAIKENTNKKPIIFLSYASYAKQHASILKLEIERVFSEKYHVTQYQDPDFEDILNKAMHEIKNCDYFIGVWHHEFLDGKDEYGISPWMPFEYGIAKNSSKKIIIIRSDKLPEQIWKRIDPGISKPSYNDLNFKDVLLPLIISYIREKW